MPYHAIFIGGPHDGLEMMLEKLLPEVILSMSPAPADYLRASTPVLSEIKCRYIRYIRRTTIYFDQILSDEEMNAILASIPIRYYFEGLKI